MASLLAETHHHQEPEKALVINVKSFVPIEQSPGRVMGELTGEN